MNQTLALLMVGALLALTTPAAVAGSPTVSGEVTQKFTPNPDHDFVIAVDGWPYTVPFQFWVQVDLGDKVLFDGTEWRIVVPFVWYEFNR